MKNEFTLEGEWLAALADSARVLTVNTCRCDYLKNRWHIPEKEMEEHLVFLVESGPMNVRLNGNEVPIETGSVVWIPPGIRRELWGDNRQTPLRYCKIRFNLGSGEGVPSFRNFAIKPNAWDLLPIFRMLVGEFSTEYPWQTEQLRALLSLFSVTFFRVAYGQPSARRLLTATQRHAIEEFVTMHMDTHMTSIDLARVVNLSQDYFSRAFVRTYEETPRSYLKRMRIRYAANRLAESPVSIKELSCELGYNNVNLFCRQFKEVEGVTPSQYREHASGRGRRA